MERTQRQYQEPAQVSISRSYPVSPDKVWRAWTDPQALSQWFGLGEARSETKAELDPHVGGQYRIRFSGPDGEIHEVSGVYEEVELHRRLVFTWGWKSTPERVSRISIDLRPIADGTELSFVHDRFFDDQARANHERGWAAFFANLDNFLQPDI